MRKFYVLLFLAFYSLSMFAQTSRTVTGTVLDKQSGSPLVGVNVLVGHTMNGVVTDINGNYSINVKPNDSILVFSYVGFFKKRENIRNKTKVNVAMEEDIQGLDEIVVVGYGTQKRSDLTGAISTVNMKEMDKISVANVDQALQGQVAGVDITSNSGTPGDPVMVRIRGIGTLNNSNPLFVVDGMMVDDINFLNPADIESVEVLKDASATAIYGSRGSNGVIIITTKKGAKGGRVHFNYYHGWQNFWRSTNVMDSKTWGALKNEAMVAAGNPAPIPDPSALHNTVWFDEIRDVNAPIQNADLSFSGGGEKGNYFLSTDYFMQDGIVKKSGYNRLSLRANSSYKVKPWLQVGENLTLVGTEKEKEPWTDEWTSIIITSIAADPASPVRNEDGTFARGIYNDTWNPAAIIEYQNYLDKVYRTIGNVYLNLNFTNWLSFKTNYSIEYSFGRTSNFEPIYYVSPVQQNAITNLDVNNSSRFISQWSNMLNFNKVFGHHAISALLGTETYSYRYQYNGISVNGIPSNDIDIRYIDNATGNNNATVWGSAEDVRQISYLARVNYSFNDKYLLTANFRADASSKFTEKNRWGYFPSFSVGWKISEEDFMKNIDVISNLKLRAGWGQIGNQGSVPPYQDVTTASPGANYIWGGQLAPGYSFPGAGNPEIRWETTSTTNFGLDFGLWEGRLSGSVEYFNKITDGMLLQVPIPGVTGIQEPPTQNAGKMKNNGFEFSALYKNMDHAFKYSFGAIFTTIHNEVVDLGAEDAFIDGALFMNSFYVTRTAVGMPIAQFYGYKTDGLFQNQAEIDAQTAQQNVAPGDVRYVDEDNDGELDFFYLGSPLPKFTYSFNTNLMYKGFDLGIFLQGVYGNKIFNGTAFYKRSSTATWNLGKDMINRWTGESTQNDAKYPRMNANDVNNSLMSDRYLEDGSYLRIKNVQLGYTFSNRLIKKMKLEKLRVYLNAQNLYTFTKYSGLDPEVGINYGSPLDIGVDRGRYPQARMYSVGLNLVF